MERRPNDASTTTARLKAAVASARSGRWDDAHDIAQALEGEPMADWLHAVLHKIEGDDGNARYWYRRCGKRLKISAILQPSLPLLPISLQAITLPAHDHGHDKTVSCLAVGPERSLMGCVRLNNRD